MSRFMISYLGKALNSLLISYSLFPVNAKQNTTADPYITYDTLRVDSDKVKGEVAWADMATVLIAIFSTRYDVAKANAIAVRTILDNYKGTTGGITIDGIYFIDESDEWEDNTKRHMVIQEYVVRIINT